MKKDLKDILTDAKGEAMASLEYAVRRSKEDIEFVREIAYVHSNLCIQYYEVVKDEIDARMLNLNKVNGDYR